MPGVEFFGQFLLQHGTVNREQLRKALELQEAHNRKIGSYAVSEGLITHEQGEAINLKQRREDRPFCEIAIEMGLVTPSQADKLLALQRKRHLLLGAALVELGHIDSKQLEAELAAFHESQRRFQIDEVRFPPDTEPDKILAIPVELARKLFLRMVGIKVKLGRGISSLGPPSDKKLTSFLEFTGDWAFKFALTVSRDIGVHVARGFFRKKTDFTDELVADALNEFCNILCGDACALYSKMGLRINISIPTVGVPGSTPTILFPLHMPEEVAEIRIYL